MRAHDERRCAAVRARLSPETRARLDALLQIVTGVNLPVDGGLSASNGQPHL